MSVPYLPRTWSQFGFSPQHTGYNPYERTIGTWNVSQLAVKWADETDVPSSASFAVVSGNAYAETDNGTFYALDAATGALRWGASVTSGSSISTPAVVNGVLYFTASDGYLYAFNAAGCGAMTCAPLWKVYLQNFQAVDPMVANGVIYVGANFRSNIAAYNATTGALLWSTPLNAGVAFFRAPALANGVVYVGADVLYAFNASTGALLWTSTGSGDSAPTIANGIVYEGAEDGTIFAYSAAGCGSATCSPLWQASAGTVHAWSLAVANGLLYVGTDDGNLDAFPAAGCGSATCSPTWTGHVSAQYEGITSSLSVANGVVYFGSSYGTLYAFKAAGCGSSTCNPLWTYATGGLIDSTPVVINGAIYLSVFNYGSNMDEKFYAFSVPTTPRGMP
jgi:outer membrane protein assembly factor BamB